MWRVPRGVDPEGRRADESARARRGVQVGGLSHLRRAGPPGGGVRTRALTTDSRSTSGDSTGASRSCASAASTQARRGCRPTNGGWRMACRNGRAMSGSRRCMSASRDSGTIVGCWPKGPPCTDGEPTGRNCSMSRGSVDRRGPDRSAAHAQRCCRPRAVSRLWETGSRVLTHSCRSELGRTRPPLNAADGWAIQAGAFGHRAHTT